MEIILKNYTIKATGEEFDKASDYMVTKLADPSAFGGPWFRTTEEAEEWLGDMFYDAICYYLEGLGISIELEE